MPLPLSTVAVLCAIGLAIESNRPGRSVLLGLSIVLMAAALVNEGLRFLALRQPLPAPPAGPRPRELTPHVGGEE